MAGLFYYLFTRALILTEGIPFCEMAEHMKFSLLTFGNEMFIRRFNMKKIYSNLSDLVVILFCFSKRISLEEIQRVFHLFHPLYRRPKRDRPTDNVIVIVATCSTGEKMSRREEIQRNNRFAVPILITATASKQPGSCQGPPAASRPDTAGDRRHDTIRSSPSGRASSLINY